MKLSIERDELLRGLGRVQAIVERRGTMPILANVLIEARDDGLTLAATDLEVAVVARHAAKVKTPGSVTLGAKKLYEIARELEHPEVTLVGRRRARDASPAGPRSSTCSRPRPRSTRACPAPRTRPSRRSTRRSLAELIDHTLYAASTDETRYNLNGVFVESADGKKIRFVATDGYRISQIERSVPNEVAVPRQGHHRAAQGRLRDPQAVRRGRRRARDRRAATASCWCAGPISC